MLIVPLQYPKNWYENFYSFTKHGIKLINDFSFQASQLAAQAKEERNSSGGGSGNNEMTYFIPLQSTSSGESFGVAVKLGTEGPEGPNQKVIMKAKLVTQPKGKPIAARVIGSKTEGIRCYYIQLVWSWQFIRF